MFAGHFPLFCIAITAGLMGHTVMIVLRRAKVDSLYVRQYWETAAVKRSRTTEVWRADPATISLPGLMELSLTLV